jgi:hypothetical protein
VKMGSVNINDVRQGKRDKILHLLCVLTGSEDKRKALVSSLSKGTMHGWYMVYVNRCMIWISLDYLFCLHQCFPPLIPHKLDFSIPRFCLRVMLLPCVGPFVKNNIHPGERQDLSLLIQGRTSISPTACSDSQIIQHFPPQPPNMREATELPDSR